MKRVRRRKHRRHPAGTAWLPPEEEGGYDGRAVLRVGDRTLDVTVHLHGHLEPLDGRFHWYGRIERSAEMTALKATGAAAAELTVDGGPPVPVRLAEHDPWGHVQVNGTGRPPYPRHTIEVDLPT